MISHLPAGTRPTAEQQALAHRCLEAVENAPVNDALVALEIAFRTIQFRKMDLEKAWSQGLSVAQILNDGGPAMTSPFGGDL